MPSCSTSINSNLAISVGRVGFELIRRAVDYKNSLRPIVAGYVVQKIVIARAIHREPVLVICRRRISPEPVLLRQVVIGIAIHHEAEKIACRRHVFHFRKVHALKVNASAKVRDNAGSVDIYVRYPNDHDARWTISKIERTSDGVAVQIQMDVACIDRYTGIEARKIRDKLVVPPGSDSLATVNRYRWVCLSDFR